MGRFLLRRLIQSAVALLGTITLVFFIQHLAGDPTLLMLPEGATREDIATLRHQLGFDRPLAIQYLDYLAQLARFDLGQSLVQRVPVSSIIAARLPYTLYLAGGALLVAVGIGLPVGIVMAVRRDQSSSVLMALVRSGKACRPLERHLLICCCRHARGDAVSDGIRSVVLPDRPWCPAMATYARVARTAVLEELGRDYVSAAQAKGLLFRRVISRHILRNAATPIITISALEIANLLAGAVIVETVFAWPGLGQLAVQSIAARDFPIVQSIVLLSAFVSIALNLAADILYSVVDPRIRLDGTA